MAPVFPMARAGVPDPLGTWTLVVHYNNPASMAGTAAHLAAVGFAKERIVVYCAPSVRIARRP